MFWLVGPKRDRPLEILTRNVTPVSNLGFGVFHRIWANGPLELAIAAVGIQFARCCCAIHQLTIA